MENELPMEDYYVPEKLKTLKELMFLEEDNDLKTYLETLDANNDIKIFVSNGAITRVDIINGK